MGETLPEQPLGLAQAEEAEAGPRRVAGQWEEAARPSARGPAEPAAAPAVVLRRLRAEMAAEAVASLAQVEALARQRLAPADERAEALLAGLELAGLVLHPAVLL